MARIRFLLVLVVLLLGGLLALPAAQTLSSQVLQLLTRVNTWTGRQTFQDLRLSSASPSDTNQRLYNISGGLYWNGALVVSGGGGGAVHNILSASHGDATVATVTRGGLIVGQGGSPTWSLLTVGAAGTFLRSDGTDVAWGTDGSGLTSLNAGALASGTVPLARISGLTNAQIDGAAAIAWSKINTAGSSLANLTTRSASDLDSGTLADARLSANVSLFGTSVQTAEILDGTILFADWAANGCTSGQYPQYNGTTWICSTVTPGSGTVTSVGLTLPTIFSVAGSPVTGSGTLAATLASQSANLVWAGPSSGGAAAPTFRSLVYDDFPTSAAAAGTYPKVTINNKGIVTGTAAQITLTTDVTGTLPLANGGTGLNAAADDSVLLSNGTAWSAVALSNCTAGLTYTTATNTFGCSGTGTAHALLSATHTDTLTASVTRGDLIVGSATPQWTRLALGASEQILTSNGTDPVWSDAIQFTMPAAKLNQYVRFDASPGLGEDWMVSDAYREVRWSLTPAARATGNAFTSPPVWIRGVATPNGASGAVGVQLGASFTEAASGTHSSLRGVSVSTPVIAPDGATVGAAYTMFIDAAPNAVGAENYALYVAAGRVSFQSGVEERFRSVKMGEWTTVTYNGSNFTAGGSQSWTVEVGDQTTYAYTEVGLTQTLSVVLATTTVGGTANPELRVAIPNGRTAARTTSGSCVGLNNSAAFNGFWQATSGNAYVSIFNEPTAGTNWAAATNTTQVRCMITVSF